MRLSPRVAAARRRLCDSIHLRGPAHGGRHHPVVDDDDAQVLPGDHLLEQHPRGIALRLLECGFELVRFTDVQGDPPALLALGRLDHHPLVFGEEGQVALALARRALGRHAQARGAQQLERHRLVLAAAHGDGRGQLAQRFTAHHRTPAELEPEVAVGRVQHLDRDAAPARLVDDDLRVDVELGFRAGPHEQGLVDRIFLLQAEHRHAHEAQILVQGDGLVIVVHHRQIHERAPACRVMIRQRGHQTAADPGIHGLLVHRQAPQARAVFRILEGARVIDPGDRADHLAGVGILGHQVGEHRRVAVLPHQLRVHLHHAVRAQDAVDRRGVRRALQPADQESARLDATGQVLRQPQPVGMRRIQEQLLRRLRKHHVRIAQVQGDVALARAFLAQGLGERTRVAVGVGEDEPPPAAANGHIVRGQRVRLGVAIPGIDHLQRRRVAALDPGLVTG